MLYDVTQTKAVLEAGPILTESWISQFTEGVHWDENNFSYRDWAKLYVNDLTAEWTVGSQFAAMMPLMGGGEGATTGAYNKGFNNGLVIGLKLKRR